MNKKGFTLIELLAVIIILAIVTLIGATTVLPYMSDAREKAFNVEAHNVVSSAKRAMELYNLGEITLTSDTVCSDDKDPCLKCYKSSDKSTCFSVLGLINLGIYDADKFTFTGKVVFDENGDYTLYFKKNNEFKIVGAKNAYTITTTDSWVDEEYNVCNCEVTGNNN